MHLICHQMARHRSSWDFDQTDFDYFVAVWLAGWLAGWGVSVRPRGGGDREGLGGEGVSITQDRAR